MSKHTHTAPFTATVSLHPLRGRDFDNLPAALRYVGCLAATRFVVVELRTPGHCYSTSGPAVIVSQKMIDYIHTRKRARLVEV